MIASSFRVGHFFNRSFVPFPCEVSWEANAVHTVHDRRECRELRVRLRGPKVALPSARSVVALEGTEKTAFFLLKDCDYQFSSRAARLQ